VQVPSDFFFKTFDRNLNTNVYYYFFSYVQYSNIAARVVRKSLKPQLQVDALKRDVVNVKFTKWENGKAVGKLRNDLSPFKS
jgi:F-type H+-transporting ATPase subunit epsilon